MYANAMEQYEENDASNAMNTPKADISPKSKQKKKSLCRMLMNKKTKVGCLESSCKDDNSHKHSKMENSQHGSHTSTKLSLCCAMTERSRTPPQSLTVSRLSPTTLSRTSVKSEVASANGNCQTDVFVEKEEAGAANNIHNVPETIVEKNKVLVGREQQQDIFVEGNNSYFTITKCRSFYFINLLHSTTDYKYVDFRRTYFFSILKY